jgi:hypothetical protein
MLQEIKGQHEPGIDSRRSHAGGTSGVKLSLKRVPVEPPGKFCQGVMAVDDGFDLRLKNINFFSADTEGLGFMDFPSFRG